MIELTRDSVCCGAPRVKTMTATEVQMRRRAADAEMAKVMDRHRRYIHRMQERCLSVFEAFVRQQEHQERAEGPELEGWLL